ncbi:hypothetical protein TeGR_g2264 [Tetraparma gracilis]|uniref:Uncharacterized protein n=1 Tax=Tetraparma gracilis TaxID=2962635 RepID=A0ABQ6M6S3_9STRA|nr:hypothetical protein TeGR_g2264 [Tetraparma gracilis]
MTNISNSCDFSSLIPPLIAPSTDRRILEQALEMLASFLKPITAHHAPPSHPAHSIAINLHTPEIISSFIDLIAFKQSLSLTPANMSCLLTSLAGICAANRSSDILPTTSLASTCLALLSSNSADPSDKQLLELILGTFTPSHENPAVALSQFINGRLVPPAAKLLQQHLHNNEASYGLLICALDNGAVALIFNELANVPPGSSSDPAALSQTLACLDLLGCLARIAFSPSSPNPATAAERYEGAVAHYQMTNGGRTIVESLVSYLESPDSLFDEAASTRAIK